jgi:hypothetical protein
MVFERWTNPKPQRRTRSPVPGTTRTGYHRVEGNRRASRNGPVSALPAENPYRRDSQNFASLYDTSQ